MSLFKLNHKPAAVALLLATIAPSCTISSSYQRESTGPFVIAEVFDANGRSVEYTVVPGGNKPPAIHRVLTEELQVPRFGITPASLTRDLAENLGLPAWNGVYLSSVEGNSAAHEAGLRRGDVLLMIQDEAINAPEQCIELIQSLFQPEDLVDVTYLHRDGTTWVEHTATISVGAKAIRETSTDRIPLKAMKLVKERTGLEVATVPANLSSEIWDIGEPIAMVTGVISGSPGYHAGVRKSDRVLRCNGRVVETAEDLVLMVQEGAEQLELELDGPLGPHTARVSTDADIDARHSTNIPILYEHYSSVSRSSTSFLEFIFQFGFTKSHRYLPSSTRETLKRSSLSILPLGMFEFERTPTTSTNTLFWLITWSTRR